MAQALVDFFTPDFDLARRVQTAYSKIAKIAPPMTADEGVEATLEFDDFCYRLVALCREPLLTALDTLHPSAPHEVRDSRDGKYILLYDGPVN